MIQSIKDGRREDGNRSIADKIIKCLHDLDKTVENNQGRWAWELLQNAKDSIVEDQNRTVSVQIELNEDSVEFRHNGTHFTGQDVRGLINQISSKEVEEGQHTKKTGRFGTGFLTTHLLSRVVKLKGIVETDNNDLSEFKFILDRKGKTTNQLIPKIETTWNEFDDSVINNMKINATYDQNKFNTSFCYQLETKEQKEIAKIGVEEFSKLVPFVLAFIPKISRVEIIDNTLGNTTVFENNQEVIDGLIVPVAKTENEKETNILILYASNEKVKIATEIEKTEKGYSVKDIKNVPKLFCDFPLIGTENFHFPVVVNSFFFSPQTERDGIWLKGSDDVEVEENQKLLESAVELYKNLLSQITEKDFFDLYNLAETKMPSTSEKYFDKTWYKHSIQKPIREFIWNVKIVEIEDEISEKQAIKDLWFPDKDFSKAVRDKIWQFAFDLHSDIVCKKIHLHNWCDISWESWKTINFSVLVKNLVKQENIYKLSQSLKKEEHDTLDWLNYFGNFIFKDDSNLALLKNNAIIPNQNGIFRERSDLYIDEIQDDDLIDILRLLGEDWKNILRHNSINFGYNSKEKKDIKYIKDIAVKITEKLKKTDDKNENLSKAIIILSKWFENNPEQGKEFFAELYRKRAELFMNTIEDKESLYNIMRTSTDLSKLAEVAEAIERNPIIIENLQKSEELTSLLKEFNQDTLVSLGVTSMEELKKVLEDKDIAALCTHTPTPTSEMFHRAQELIKRSKANVLKYLKTLPSYDCEEEEDLATTVIGGIKKDGIPISVVVRPSDNNKVIIYYGSEKDTLDDPETPAELWIDNGIDDPRHLTLGKILKITGINIIPL
ncbi:MAG: hypothetical protein WA919_14115 [Coleofasciculaceae cyanobacterium]